LDAQQQSVGVDLTLDKESRHLVEIVNQGLGEDKGFDVGSRGFYMQLSMAGSLAPMIMSDSVASDATAEVTAHVKEGAEEAAHHKKEELYSMIPKMIEGEVYKKVSAGVNASPMAGMMSPEQKTQLIQSQVDANLPDAIQMGTPAVKAKIDAAVEQGKEAALPGAIAKNVEDHVDSRMDELVTETSFQRLRATFALPINPFGNAQEKPPGLIILSFGKDHLDLGPQLRPNMLSDWENTIGRITPSERGLTSASTGYASLGIAYAINENLRLLVNVIGFHDRDPWVSAQQYLAHSFQISKSTFDRQQEVAALDSIATVVKTIFGTKNLTGSFWGTLVKRQDPNPDQNDIGFSFGGFVKQKKSGTSLHFAYADSGKAYFNKTWGVGIAQQIVEKVPNSYLPGLLVYTDYRGEGHKAEGLVVGSSAGDRQIIAFGVKADIMRYVDTQTIIDASLTAEYQKVVAQGGHRFDGIEANDFFIGVNANVQYDLYKN
jgi:hypothetical protein